MPPKIKNVMKDIKAIDLLQKFHKYFIMEKNMNRPWSLQNPTKRLVKATGIKQTTLRRYLRDRNDPVQDVVKFLHRRALERELLKAQKIDESNKGEKCEDIDAVSDAKDDDQDEEEYGLSSPDEKSHES